MNYQHYTDGLATLQPDVQAYIKKCVATHECRMTRRVNIDYLSILEKDSGMLESIEALDILTDRQWNEVFEHQRENY